MSADTYHCPVCGKPFDLGDKLFDFAIAAHEKDHKPENNNPANLIKYDQNSLMWCCNLCGDPLHMGEFTARQKVIGHCRTKHGALFSGSSSTPVTARGGRGSGSRSVGEVAEDVGEAIVDGVSRVIGGIFRALGGD
jgi:hypothetical protein